MCDGCAHEINPLLYVVPARVCETDVEDRTLVMLAHLHCPAVLVLECGLSGVGLGLGN
jgi:hypothetical protein